MEGGMDGSMDGLMKGWIGGGMEFAGATCSSCVGPAAWPWHPSHDRHRGHEGSSSLRAIEATHVSANIMVRHHKTVSMTVWPSGLRRWLQAPVRKGVESNPTTVSSISRRRITAI